MKIDLERSLIFDTISFFDTFFNESKRIEDYNSYEYDIDLSFKFFNILKPLINVEYDYYALFYREYNKLSFVKRFFCENLDIISSFNDFIMILKSDTFHTNFNETFFNLDSIDFKSQIFNSDYPGNIKSSLMILVCNYDSCICSFCTLFEKIYNALKDIYSQNMSMIKSFKLKNKDIQIIESYAKDHINYDRDTFIISLILPYILNILNYSDKTYYICGYNVHAYIVKDNDYKYISVTHTTIIDMLYNPHVIQILELLKENHEMTSPEIINMMIDKYKCTSITIQRALGYMANEKMICVSKKTYYSIDKEYFKRAKVILSMKSSTDDNIEIHKHMNLINSILLPNEDYKKIIELFSNDYVLPILNIIKAYKQINSSKIIEIISDKYNCANSTVYRILTLLLDNGVIYISKRVSNKVFYSINEAFFVQAEQEMANLFHFYIDK